MLSKASKSTRAALLWVGSIKVLFDTAVRQGKIKGDTAPLTAAITKAHDSAERALREL